MLLSWSQNIESVERRAKQVQNKEGAKSTLTSCRWVKNAPHKPVFTAGARGRTMCALRNHALSISVPLHAQLHFLHLPILHHKAPLPPQ
eukprot:5625864-Amphidinium_carterae.2